MYSILSAPIGCFSCPSTSLLLSIRLDRTFLSSWAGAAAAAIYKPTTSKHMMATMGHHQTSLKIVCLNYWNLTKPAWDAAQAQFRISRAESTCEIGLKIDGGVNILPKHKCSLMVNRNAAHACKKHRRQALAAIKHHQDQCKPSMVAGTFTLGVQSGRHTRFEGVEDFLRKKGKETSSTWLHFEFHPNPSFES